MGQHQSREEESPFVLPPDKKVRYEDMDLDRSIMGFADDVTVEKTPCCRVIICNPKTIVAKEQQEWKVFLLKRLEKMQTDEWPQILLKVLKESERKTLDQYYQTELIYLCCKDPKKELQKQKSIQRGSEIELKDRHTNCSDSTRTKKVEEQYDMSPMSPLKTFDVSEREEDLSPPRHASWMENSYNIKAVEDREAMVASIGFLNEIRNGGENLEAAGTNMKRVSLQKRLSSVYQYQNRYDNYTVLFPNLGEAPVSKQDEKAVQRYKDVFRMVESHLKADDNIFCRLIKAFEEYYVRCYSDLYLGYQGNAIPLIKMRSHIIKATLDLQQFIGMLYESMNLFYKLEKIKSKVKNSWKDLLTRDNVLNFITSFVLSEDVYQTIFNLYSIEDSESEQLYQKNVRLCQNFKPEDFGVPDEYCLNNRTVSYMKRKGLIPGGETEDTTRISFHMEEAPLNSRPSRTSSCLDTDERKEDIIEKRTSINIDSLPYRQAIATLSELKFRRSPIHKIKTILKSAELISSSIEEFYKGYGITNKKRLDADQTLSLFLYLVSKSGLNDVSTHYKIVEKFTTNNVLNSTSGYYATTMGACVACICSMDLKPDSSVRECRDSIRKFIRTSRAGVGSFAQRTSMNSNPDLSL